MSCRLVHRLAVIAHPAINSSPMMPKAEDHWKLCPHPAETDYGNPAAHPDSGTANANVYLTTGTYGSTANVPSTTSEHHSTRLPLAATHAIQPIHDGQEHYVKLHRTICRSQVFNAPGIAPVLDWPWSGLVIPNVWTWTWTQGSSLAGLLPVLNWVVIPKNFTLQLCLGLRHFNLISFHPSLLHSLETISHQTYHPPFDADKLSIDGKTLWHVAVLFAESSPCVLARIYKWYGEEYSPACSVPLTPQTSFLKQRCKSLAE